MHTGKGQVVELILEDGLRLARISCPAALIPSPGQYLLAGDGSTNPLPVPLFHSDSASSGFIAAPPVPDLWNPGQEIYLRGPFGHGFELPLSARRVALVAFDNSPSRLRGLTQPALKQEAEVALVCESNPETLSHEVEIHPLSALSEIMEWADYAAFDVGRENWHKLQGWLLNGDQVRAVHDAQILICTPIPCGGIAECGVCAVALKSEWKLACKDGPVFNWRDT
jgi:dihydroorotate dehydrogenase electron transfer subunit